MIKISHLAIDSTGSL